MAQMKVGNFLMPCIQFVLYVGQKNVFFKNVFTYDFDLDTFWPGALTVSFIEDKSNNTAEVFLLTRDLLLPHWDK